MEWVLLLSLLYHKCMNFIVLNRSETLQSLKYVQRTGQGADIIFREMVMMGKPYPVYRVFNAAVQLTIVL